MALNQSCIDLEENCPPGCSLIGVLTGIYLAEDENGRCEDQDRDDLSESPFVFRSVEPSTDANGLATP